MANYVVKDNVEHIEIDVGPYQGVARIRAQKYANRTGRATHLESDAGDCEEVLPSSQQNYSPWK
jgi:hypothetical protein